MVHCNSKEESSDLAKDRWDNQLTLNLTIKLAPWVQLLIADVSKFLVHEIDISWNKPNMSSTQDSGDTVALTAYLNYICTILTILIYIIPYVMVQAGMHDPVLIPILIIKYITSD